MKTDQQLQQDVIAELGWDPSVNASQIGVEVKDGIVTLAGHVSSFTEKWQAQRAAQRVGGVRGLAVEMDVTLPAMSARTDADLARTIVNALQSLSCLPADSVQVMVEQAWVTLSGEAEWNYQRLDAADVVRGLIGVRGLSENIRVRSKSALPSSIKSEIEAALRRRLDANLQDITVAVHDSDVTLSGRVQSLWDRERARAVAWSSAGVTQVKDDLRISFI